MTTKTQHAKTLDEVKSVLRGKFIAVDTYTRISESSKNNQLRFHLNKLEEEVKTKPNVTRRK